MARNMAPTITRLNAPLPPTMANGSSPLMGKASNIRTRNENTMIDSMSFAESLPSLMRSRSTPCSSGLMIESATSSSTMPSGSPVFHSILHRLHSSTSSRSERIGMTTKVSWLSVEDMASTMPVTMAAAGAQASEKNRF